MYSAQLSLRANAHTCHDKQFNKQPNDQGKGSHTKEGRPVMPRAKPEGETQAGNQPIRRGLGRRDYSRLRTAGTRTGITDPFLSAPPFPSQPPLTPPLLLCRQWPSPAEAHTAIEVLSAVWPGLKFTVKDVCLISRNGKRVCWLHRAMEVWELSGGFCRVLLSIHLYVWNCSVRVFMTVPGCHCICTADLCICQKKCNSVSCLSVQGFMIHLKCDVECHLPGSPKVGYIRIMLITLSANPCIVLYHGSFI